MLLGLTRLDVVLNTISPKRIIGLKQRWKGEEEKLMDHNDEITAKELANMTGETYHTIDHWTDMRLLKVKRIRGRKRYYDKQESIRRCKKIRDLQNQKYGLELIAKELEKGD